jgi:hypothetical protein
MSSQFRPAIALSTLITRHADLRRKGERTITKMNQIRVPPERLDDVQRTFYDYQALFDSCFERRDWADLRDCLERLLREMQILGT